MESRRGSVRRLPGNPGCETRTAIRANNNRSVAAPSRARALVINLKQSHLRLVSARTRPARPGNDRLRHS